MVHFVLKEEISASAHEVWRLIGPEFAESLTKWSMQFETSRKLKKKEVPKRFVVAKDAPVPGRVLPSPFGNADLLETITAYSDEKMTLTFSIAYPLPLVDLYENTIHVKPKDENTCKLIIQVEFYTVPCFLGNLVEKKVKTTLKGGPAGDLKDIKTYFEKKATEKEEKEPDVDG